MTGFTESSSIQGALISRLVDLGWEHISGKDLPRMAGEVFVEEHLVAAITTLNAEARAEPSRVDEILPRLRAACLSAVNDGLVPANERMTTWLRGHQTVQYVGTDEYVPVRLLDLLDPSANRLVVSDEVTFGAPGHSRRYDIVLWVNGLPLVVGETKSPVAASVSWLNGAIEIHDVYEAEGAPFFVTNVLSFATEGRELHYGAVGQQPSHWLHWGRTTDPLEGSDGDRVLRAVDLLLNPTQILSILRDYVLYDRQKVGGRSSISKLIPRYPQVEGVEAIHRRVLDPERRQGLIWHYQGSGKTLLMAYAALRLLNDPETGGPTVLIVLDRLELVEQTVRQFQTVGLPRLRVAGTREQLQTMLSERARGIIVTTIFRFAGSELLDDNEDIVVLVDEAHRTQEGALGTAMRVAIPNAQFFGLTGTPISSAEHNTFALFGDSNDPGWVLNRYTIERSIADGASVPIHVETRLVDFHIDKDALDEAFAVMADEEQLTDEERELLADRAASARTIVRNPERVGEVTSDIVNHFVTKVAPLNLKAQVVAYDRELCVLYHDEIVSKLEHLGLASEVEVAVVMSVGSSKDEPAEWRERFGLTRDEEAEVKARFRDADDPLRILVVTAKLLTGFDAGIEGVMYLDKPLRMHSLFQAICRTNRRYTNPVSGQEKRYGLIVDYVGLGSHIASALRDADPELGGRRPVDVDALAEEFVAAIQRAVKRFAGIDRSDVGFESLMAAQDRISDTAERESFAAEFNLVSGLWEFLHPSPVLVAHRDDYRWLAQVYESVQPSGVPDALLWHRLGAKTLELVHGHISEVRVTSTGLDEVIVDAETIEAIRRLAIEDGAPGQGGDYLTVAEALDSIEARLRRRLESGHHRVWLALSERLERLRTRSLTQAAASIEFLSELLEVATAVTAAERAEEAGELDQIAVLPDPNVGALTQILAEYAPPDTPVVIESVVHDIDSIVRQVRFTGWTETQNGDRTVRKEMRLVLKKYGLPTTGDLFDHAYAYISENY